MMGQLRIMQGGHLKIREDWEKFKYEGHTKFLGGLKNRGGKAFRGPVTEACIGISMTNESVLDKHIPFEVF